MAGSLDKYRNLIKKLLPQGFAWDQVRLHPILEGFAGEFCRVGERISDLLREIFPQTSFELLEDWETALGIPDECTPDDRTLDERRQQVIQKLATIGSLSASFYEDIGAFYGYDITVENHLAFQAGRSVAGDDLTNYEPPRNVFLAGEGVAGDQLKVPGWLHYFNAELPLAALEPFEAGQDTAGTPLVIFGNQLLQCTIKRLKPAHSGVTFTFK